MSSCVAHAVEKGLGVYLETFICPQPGDWPAQFYMQQLHFNVPRKSPALLQHIVPFIGPLHVQLNARECVCCLNNALFQFFYKWVFGKHKKLANTPQAWRVTLVLDTMYGGWTLIRDQALISFSQCKDIQHLTFINILDNYLPTVLSMYSIAFKSGKTMLYIDALLRVWTMVFCYKRHHYNKAPLVWLSNSLFWKKNDHPLFPTIM